MDDDKDTEALQKLCINIFIYYLLENTGVKNETIRHVK